MVNRRPRKNKPTVPTVRVSVIVVNEEEKLLLVKHKKKSGKIWALPGGRLEYGESFFECARREVKEETGFLVKPEKIVFMSEALAPDRSRHVVNVFVKANLEGGELKVGDEEVLLDCQFIAVHKFNSGMKLFPPVGKQLLELVRGNIAKGKEVRYLGNLWM